MSRLWYQEPAKDWNEALPLGNGSLGAMVYGKPECEYIQFNEDSVWYGGPTDRNNPDAKESLPKIRQLLNDGRIQEAEKLMLEALSGTPQSQRHYQPLGEAFLDFQLSSDYEEYKRCLDLDTAVLWYEFKEQEVTYRREMFFSHPASAGIIRVTASQPGKINLSSILMREKFYDYVKKIDNHGVMLGGNLGKGGLDFLQMMTVKCIGGSLNIIGEHIVVEAADEIILYYTGGTTFRHKDLEGDLLQILDAAMAKDYESLKREHIEDYQQFYQRVDLNLETSEAFEKLPMDQRIELADSKDAGLYKTYFDYGRYLMISGSREGTLPMNLQGIWNNEMLPPWGCKYTININTEMNYWPAEICNLSECHMPLFDLIERMVPNGEVTAQKMYGCRGFVAHHNTDIWADTAVQDHWIPGSYWVMGAAWLCTHQWTHYQYTLDQEFLKKQFPIMREAALFFKDFLIERNGYLVTCPSVSPENTYLLPNGEQGANGFGVTMDNQILRDLFHQCIEAAKILGVDDELNHDIKTMYERLIPTQIGKHGQIMEWEKDYDELEPGHRHISHLYGLHPSEQILIDETPELAKAAKITLERRLANGGGHTGWSRAWIINHYAKLWDSEKAFENLRMLIKKSTLSNMLDNHPPFQIDGNFGGTAGIAEMLVQSTLERIVLLPALPQEWQNGHVYGLCVKGGATVDMTWENGVLTKAVLHAKHNIKTEVKYKGNAQLITANAGESISIPF